MLNPLKQVTKVTQSQSLYGSFRKEINRDLNKYPKKERYCGHKINLLDYFASDKFLYIKVPNLKV